MLSRNLGNATTLRITIALGALVSLHASSVRAEPPATPTIISACPATGIVISEPGDYVLDVADATPHRPQGRSAT